MKRPLHQKKSIRYASPPASIETGGWFKSGFFALMFHAGLIVLLSINLKPLLTKMEPSVYRVTLRALPAQGNGPGSGNSVVNLPNLPAEKPKVEPPKTVSSPPKEKNVEGLMPAIKKEEEKKKKALKALQASLEEMRRKAALEKIKKRVDSREISESRSGTGEGNPGGVPWGSPKGTSDYIDQIKEAYRQSVMDYIGWNLMEEFRGRTDLKTSVVVIVDKNTNILSMEFDQRSTNVIFDQSTIRALKKKMRLPPIPSELDDGENTIVLTFIPPK